MKGPKKVIFILAVLIGTIHSYGQETKKGYKLLIQGNVAEARVIFEERCSNLPEVIEILNAVNVDSKDKDDMYCLAQIGLQMSNLVTIKGEKYLDSYENYTQIQDFIDCFENIDARTKKKFAKFVTISDVQNLVMEFENRMIEALIAENQLGSYNHFLEKCPKSKLFNEIYHLADSIAYRNAFSTFDTASLTQYLLNYDHGNFREDANRDLSIIHTYDSVNSIEECRNLLSMCSGTPYHDSAISKLKYFEDSVEEWEKIETSENIADYEDFIRSYPSAPHTKKAEQKAKTLLNTLAQYKWQKIRGTSDIDAYSRFLDLYSETVFGDTAKFVKRRWTQQYNDFEILESFSPKSYRLFLKNVIVEASRSVLSYQGAYLAVPGTLYAYIPSKGHVGIPVDNLTFLIIRVSNIFSSPSNMSVNAIAISDNYSVGWAYNDQSHDMTIFVPKEILPCDVSFLNMNLRID